MLTSKILHGHLTSDWRFAASLEVSPRHGSKTGHGGKSEKSACAFVTD